MIVKNEEKTLARVLGSVGNIADEIIIADTGSTDFTKKIARKFTKKIYDFAWVDNFALARNFAFSKATKDFVMWLDADDIITEKDRDAILELKKTLTKDFSAVTMRYNIAFDAQGNPT
jgi:glycosyltransferase involved in cell wall biosynthesis